MVNFIVFTKGYLVNGKTKKSGFAHLVVTVIVMMVALIGLLGFVLWQNVILPRINSDDAKITNNIQVNKVAYNIYTVGKQNLTFSYPRNWVVSPIDNSDSSVEIKDEDGITVAELVFGALGVGGVCPDDAEIDYTTMESEVAGVKAPKTVYFNSMIASRDGKYIVRFGLSDWNYEVDSVFKQCMLALNFNIDDSDLGYIAFADGYPDSKTDREFNSLAEAKQYLAGNKYKEIKKMIMSLAN